ncbi:YdcF family protein [Novosphingobium sp. FKTRR1]|uniref:YdcF family protein n=1 Tax=Novosphingobium sp. FKTRR1 TaxID=2879118 RepID=UPI001CEFC6B2|nr:YdcF family protein [Novosphingobium sp. FKTRR1]
MSKPPGLFRRIASAILLVWALGFLWFALALPHPAGTIKTDAVVVVTGAVGRIPRAIAVLRAGDSHRLLVSGVASEVRPAEFAAEYRVDPALMACCITLGYESFDTRTNGLEASHWITRNHVGSVRLVTTDWHMRRAAFDLTVAGPRGLVIVEDAVPSQPSLKILFLEYHKLLARVIAWSLGWKR